MSAELPINSGWLEKEQWFMRGSGIALLLAAVLGSFMGILSNPENEAAIQVMNMLIAIAMGIAGVWALWWGNSKDRIAKMLQDIQSQGAGLTRILAGMQVVIGILFLLEGFSRSGIVMLLLAVMMLISAGFFFWRGQQISKIEDMNAVPTE